ncbi:MAG: hypothetical protein COS89_05415 [Deltaproteobacteria bacterium CG07_land_8_20_14_0_80_38_7]|nr:MAG: hypothetical protein COS89_05415 [Deltaproteobacteria bacterium CG07_land_8_20_14_0_80_38_7]
MKKIPRPETEYFGKIDARKKRKIAEEKRQNLATDELERLKKLHSNHCAICGLEFEEIMFKGITIHKCFNCGAVFMKNGVLEKLCGQENLLMESFLELFNFDKEK